MLRIREVMKAIGKWCHFNRIKRFYVGGRIIFFTKETSVECEACASGKVV